MDLAQLVEHYTGIAEVMGLNPVQAWIFSDLIFTTAQVDRFHIPVFVCSSNIWLSYIHSCFSSFIIDSREKKGALTKAYKFTLKAEKLFWILLCNIK